MADDKSYAAGRFAFGVEGKFAGFIKKVSGGVLRGEVYTHKLSTSNFEKKHLSNLAVPDPLVFEVSMGMGKELWDWINASWNQNAIMKNCELQACNFNHEVMAVRVFQDALIKKVSIPALEGSSKDAAYMTIELHPRLIRYEKGSGTKIVGAENVASKKWMCSNFRLEIDGLPCARVAKIDAFSWEQKVIEDEVGPMGEPMIAPAALTVPNLKLTMSMADYWPWYEWFDTFVLQGKCTDADERSGSLTFLGPDLAEELGSISFQHLGIFSLEQEPAEANSENVSRFTVELYCEEMFIDSYTT